MSVEVFLYRRGSDSPVLVWAGLPGVCDDLGWEPSEICLQGGLHKQSLCESIGLCVNKMIEIRTPSASCSLASSINFVVGARLPGTTEDIEINSNFIKLDHLTPNVDIRFPLGWHDSEDESTYSLTWAETEQREHY